MYKSHHHFFLYCHAILVLIYFLALFFIKRFVSLPKKKHIPPLLSFSFAKQFVFSVHQYCEESVKVDGSKVCFIK